MFKKSFILISLILLFAFSFSTFSLASSTKNSRHPKKVTTITKKININTATLNDLTTLKGIGEKIAQRILNFRKKNGKFKKIEELKAVRGIGDKKFEKIKKYITVR